MKIIIKSFIFTMKGFVSFGTDFQSMYFILNIFLTDNINGVRAPQFQLAYIRYTTHPFYKYLVKLCCEVYYMRW